MAASARAFIVSRIADLSLKPFRHPQQLSPLPLRHHLHLRRSPPAASSGASPVVNCLFSGIGGGGGGGGGGVSDDFVSTRKAGFEREFSVIAAMLKRIEPLDTSLISKGVSNSAKDSMKQTISTMLGLLPSDHFSVTVRFTKAPLDSLLISSIITGYTLWNAEYRVSLMRIFETSSVEESEDSKCKEEGRVSEVQCQGDGGKGKEEVVDGSVEDFIWKDPRSFGDLSPEIVKYIQQMQSELSTVKEELSAQKQEYKRMQNNRDSDNDLLEYLRSLEADMVTELSRPSSLEVEEIIRELAQNILQKFFNDDIANEQDGICEAIVASRDFLAKLLFWCMLLGHHLRGLENRLHLSCVVGLL